MLCAGKCGRAATGHYDSGQPAADRQHSWCDRCRADLAARRMPIGLAKLVPFAAPAPAPSGPLMNAMARSEHKILAGGERKSAATIAAVPPAATGNGSFSGYLAGFGRDHGGDTIMGPAAVADSVAAVNRGEIVWALTDSHSELATAIVAMVRSAAADANGVRIAADWMPGERAQALRAMVRAGAKLGLSIDYYPDAARPDGQGGRYLDKITIVGGAVTPKPMNSMAVITEGKYAASAPVVSIRADVQARHADPDRDAEDRLLAAAADWPPRHWDRATRLALIESVTRAKVMREIDGDPERARRQSRRDFDNRYSADLSAWFAANR